MMIYNKRDKAKTSGCCGGLEKAFTIACNCLKVSRSTISHHIKELSNAGLIKCTRIGQSSYCEINEDAIKAIENFLK